MARRIDQGEGYVFEAYAEASSKVEAMDRAAENRQMDPVYPKLYDMHRKAKNHREAARVRLKAFEDVETDLMNPDLTSKQAKDLLAERERLVGELFIRLYRIDLAYKASRRVSGT